MEKFGCGKNVIHAFIYLTHTDTHSQNVCVNSESAILTATLHKCLSPTQLNLSP